MLGAPRIKPFGQLEETNYPLGFYTTLAGRPLHYRSKLGGNHIFTGLSLLHSSKQNFSYHLGAPLINLMTLAGVFNPGLGTTNINRVLSANSFNISPVFPPSTLHTF